MDLFPQYTRITNYNKLVDRFITVQSRTPSSKDKGMIFALIEILNPWHQNAQIGQNIINTLAREYYKQSNTNDLLKFENALKRVNEKLVQITQNGETDWIGKTNAVLILVNKNQIHLSYTGKIRGYLSRKDEFMPIINSKEVYTYQHPLKTFSSVISGDLSLEDRLFFSTNLLFDFLTEKNLKSIMTEENFATVPHQIASILKSRNSRNANSLCINLNLSDQSYDDLPEVIYLDEQKLDYYWGTIKNAFKTIGQHSKKSYAWTKDKLNTGKDYYKSHIAPHASKILSKTKNFSRDRITYSKQKIATTLKNLPQRKVNELKRENENNSLNVKHYYGNKEKLNLIVKKTSDTVKHIIKWFSHFLHNAFLPKNRSKTYIIVAIILLTIFIANIGYLQKINRSKEDSTQIEQSISDMEIRKDDAALAIITGDNQKATETLDTLSEELKKYENNKDFKDRIAALQNDIQKLYDKISGVNRLTDGKEIANFSDKSKYFYLFGNTAISLTITKEIYSASIDPVSNPEEISRIPSDAGNIISSTKQNENILIYTSNKLIYKLQKNTLTLVENESGSWPESKSLRSYTDNIYLLNSNVGQIYKSTLTDDKYSNAQEYIKDATDIKNSIDFAIDGYVYVLKSDGSIARFSQGAITEFSLKGIPGNSTITKPKKIVTTEDMNAIYILDDNRILEFDKEGKYTNQYNFDKSLDNITDFEIYPKTKELYIQNSGKIYKYSI